MNLVPLSKIFSIVFFLSFLFILPNDFTCRETRLHNADWFNRMITLGSIQRYAVYAA